MHKRILGIIGAGHVGSHIAYAAGMLDAADIVKICDINEIAAASQVQDLYGKGPGQRFLRGVYQRGQSL